MAADAPIDAPTAVQPAVAPAKGAKHGKKDNGKKGAEVLDAGGPSVAAHPRAARAVARAKGWGALAGFALGGYLSLPTNTVAGSMLRALLAGVVCWLAAWGGALFLWRRLVILELKGREQQLMSALGGARSELPTGAEGANARAA